MRPPQKMIRRDNTFINSTDMTYEGGSTILQHINQNSLHMNRIGLLLRWFNLRREDVVQIEITRQVGGREGNAVISHISSHPIRHSKIANRNHQFFIFQSVFTEQLFHAKIEKAFNSLIIEFNQKRRNSPRNEQNDDTFTQDRWREDAQQCLLRVWFLL